MATDPRLSALLEVLRRRAPVRSAAPADATAVAGRTAPSTDPTYARPGGAPYRLPGVSNAPQASIGPSAPRGLLNAVADALPEGRVERGLRGVQRSLEPRPGANPFSFGATLMGLNEPLGMIEGPGHAATGVLARGAKKAAGAMDNVLAGTRVVDEAGAPKRVFHGTGAAFDTFDPAKNNQHGLYGPGFYFTENADIANGYATSGVEAEGVMTPEFIRNAIARREESLQIPNLTTDTRRKLEAQQDFDRRALKALTEPEFNVRPARLALKRPFDADAPPRLRDLPNHVRSAVAEAYGGGLMASEPVSYDMLTKALGGKDRANEALRAAGFDGITHIGGGNTGSDPHRVWIAFDRPQIRSPWGAPENAAQYGAIGGLLATGAAAQRNRNGDR